MNPDYKLPNYDVSEKELDKIADEITSLMKGKNISRRRIEDIAIWQTDQSKRVHETRP